MKPYTQDDVDLVHDAIVDARLQGLRDWTDRPARAVLDALVAGGRWPAAHHQPLLTLDAEDVAALVTAAAMEAGTCPDPRLLAALDKLAGAQP